MPTSICSKSVTASGLRRSIVVRTAAVTLALFGAPVALQAADHAQPGISDGFHFSEKGGENVYRAVCQSCHMAQGQGAKGAGMYPALTNDPRLAASAYPVSNILNGYKGMPSFKNMMTDEQIADVTNYVRTHFDNHYKDAVTPADVKAMR